VFIIISREQLTCFVKWVNTLFLSMLDWREHFMTPLNKEPLTFTPHPLT